MTSVRPGPTVEEVLQQAQQRRLTMWETVQEVHRSSGTSLLRAHRLARRWRLKEVVALVKKQAGADAATLTHQRLSRWETHGEVPSPRYLRALCQLYETRPDRLGFGEDHAPAAPSPAADDRDGSSPARQQQAALAQLDSEAVEQLRLRTRNLLELPDSSRVAVDWWETRTDFYNQEYRKLAHETFLASAVADFQQIVDLMERRQPLAYQRRPQHTAAVLAGCIGVVCVDLAREHDSHAWFHIAEMAAAQTGDRALHAWVRTRRALAYLYYGTPDRAIAAAKSAAFIAGHEASIAAAMAPAVEARALARLGRRIEAQAALARCQAAYRRFESSGTTNTGLIAFPPHKLRFYEGNVLARTGRLSEAGDAQREALLQYPPNDQIDPALIKLDHALVLIRGGHLDAALNEAARAVRLLKPDARQGTVSVQAREILTAVPTSWRGSAAFRDVVALVNERS